MANKIQSYYPPYYPRPLKVCRELRRLIADALRQWRKEQRAVRTGEDA